MYAMIAAIAVAILSIIGNVLQFFMNKKSSDIDRLAKEIQALRDVQHAQIESYKDKIEMQDERITNLNERISEQNKQLEENKEEIGNLRKLIMKLLENGCHVKSCKSRKPYTISEMNSITKQIEQSRT